MSHAARDEIEAASAEAGRKAKVRQTVSTATEEKRRKVAIVQQFIPHYRGTLFEHLMDNDRYDYLFLADDKDIINKGIFPWQRPPHIAFKRTKTRKLFGKLTWQSGLLRLALRRDIDVIILLGNPYWPATWLSAALARLRGKRVLFWTIGWMMPDRGLKDWVRRRFYRLANALVLYGRFAKQMALERGFRSERLYVVFNSMNYSQQRRLREQITDADRRRTRAGLFEHPERPLLICMSRLGATRRLDQLLSAMQLLKQQGWPLNLLIVGDGPERSKLEEMARQLGVTVHFYGACYDETVLARMITAANVTVAPGLSGLTTIHSLAYGVPVISHNDWTTQAPEFEAVIPGENGDAFRRDDVADLAAVIRHWTGAELVPEKTRRACFSIVERFWNPSYQCQVIERAIDGEPADDLFWIREHAVETPATFPNK
jgi:1,2-diacylglycerol 3-alpha-glucosyltransferase